MFIFLSYLLTSTLSFAVGFDSPTNMERHEFDYSGLTQVRVENSGGKITIWPMLAQQVTAVVTWTKPSPRCSAYVAKSPDGTLLQAQIRRPAGEICEADIELRVPKTVDLDIASGSGNVNIYGIEGGLAFKVGSGTFQADGRFKQVAGRSGSGEVNIKGMAGGGSINSGSGEIKLSFFSQLRGHLEVKSGSGNATLLFPKGSKIEAALGTGSGAIKNEVGSSKGADFGISVTSGSGDLRVKNY